MSRKYLDDLVRADVPLGRLPLPWHCAVCRVSGSALCGPCASRLVPAPEPDPLSVGALDRTVALFAYSGAGRAAIARLKFHAHRDALDTWAHLMVGEVGEVPDVVTWVPTTAARRRRRGVDQAELLARAVGRSVTVPVVRALRRLDTAAQTGRGAEERRTVRLQPRERARRRIEGATVLVVDDVRTTGASLNAAAMALRRLGAARVLGATIAATPGPVNGR